METRELAPQEALSYLDDIAHGRKMEFDPHTLYCIIKRELDSIGELERAFDSLSKENEKIMKELSKEIEKNRVLKIIFDAPSIINQLFELGELGKDATQRYFWGTISDADVKKVKEFFADGKRDQSE